MMNELPSQIVVSEVRILSTAVTVATVMVSTIDGHIEPGSVAVIVYDVVAVGVATGEVEVALLRLVAGDQL